MQTELLFFAAYFAVMLVAIILYFYRSSGDLRLERGTNGQDYFFSKRRSKNGRVSISAGVPLQNGFAFSICRKTLMQRFLKSLGLAPDVQTGDPLADDAFYFMADDEERLKTLLAAPDFIALLRMVFEKNNASNIECRQDKLWFDTHFINDLDVSEEFFYGAGCTPGTGG